MVKLNASKFSILSMVAILLIALVGCESPTATPQSAIDAAWTALDPVTTSHNRANFEPVEVLQVTGKEVEKTFANQKTNASCWGTRVPANSSIGADTQYWFVHLAHRAMTPMPATRVSPTQPPAIPDWNIPEAFFLIDAHSGQVVARIIPCVVI
jgi:hypothetical protein